MKLKANSFTFLFSTISFVLIFLGGSPSLQAQSGEYMNNLSTIYSPVREELWSYMSAVANNRSARKIEKRRQDLLSSLLTSKASIRKQPAFEGDASYRDSIVSFLTFSYTMINSDYEKIVNMEEVAEQSYDAMEAYLLAIQIANEKFREAGKRLQETQRTFAAAHNVNLIDSEDDKLAQKISQADTVMRYNNKMFLLIFKSQIQETYAMAAIEKNDISALEQARSKLLEFSADNMKKAQASAAFQGDASLKTAAADLLNFYRMEAEAKLPIISDFILQKENMDKMKSALDAKPEKNRTKEEIDAYNKQVGVFNTAVNKYNTTIQELNTNRTKYLNTWNQTSAAFTSKHVANK